MLFEPHIDKISVITVFIEGRVLSGYMIRTSLIQSVIRFDNESLVFIWK